MFNPFKKKDDGFNLDETSLPSLSDSNNFEVPQSNTDSVNSTDLNPSISDFSQPTPIENPTVPTDFPVSNPINSSMSQSAFSPSPQESISINENQDLHNDLIKSKLSSLESKYQLMEAKLSNIEQKLDVIYSLLIEEVSDETKRKYSVNSMMKNIKK